MGFPTTDTTPRSIAMRKQRIEQPARAARSRLGRRRVALALALALLLVAAAASMAFRATQSTSRAAAPAAREPGQVAVLDYLRAHLTTQQPQPDAAQQGVAGYLRAHGAETTLPDMEFPWDPAVRAALDYLHGYGW